MNAAPPSMVRDSRLVVSAHGLTMIPPRHAMSTMRLIIDDPNESREAMTDAEREATRAWFTSTIGAK